MEFFFFWDPPTPPGIQHELAPNPVLASRESGTSKPRIQCKQEFKFFAPHHLSAQKLRIWCEQALNQARASPKSGTSEPQIQCERAPNPV